MKRDGWDGIEERPVTGAPGGAGGPVAGLPCLDTNNCNGGERIRSENLSAVHRKTAFALQSNVRRLVEFYGLNRVGFLTLTFARHVVSAKEGQKALHSLMSGVLKKRYPEYIIVMERMSSKRIHYHLLVVMAADIRSGFDFAAVNRGDYRSASDYLRREWQFWRTTAPKYGFGRTELLPIKENAEGIAKYIGKYIAKHIGQRLPEDKGARLVRYSKGTNRFGVRFSWTSTGAFMWRGKLRMFCRMLGLNHDNHQPRLKEWFGRNWIHQLQPLIHEIKLPEFHSAAEVQASYLAVWQVVAAELERRHPKKPQQGITRRSLDIPTTPAQMFAAWIERGLKED